MISLCSGCQKLKEIVVSEDGTDIGYCESCVEWRPQTPEDNGLKFLWDTFPFHVGDIVECRTGAVLYDGIGEVKEISFELKNGGTPVCPAIRVEFIEKSYPEVPDSLWFTEVCLKRVKNVPA